jgi:glycosyltransferase involved in cell wall biosynthesis
MEGRDVLIGIDMLSVQSPGGVGRESSRLGLRFVSALLASDSAHRYVLYTHPGLPTDRLPSARNVLRVSLGEGAEVQSRPRKAIQRVLDHNPDTLDWLVLLDPFHEGYDGLPPESPLNGVKVASLINDLAPGRVDDRRLAPVRRHDAILAYCESTAAECRLRMPTASDRIKSIGLAPDESWTGLDASEPLSAANADELGRLGIAGPFLFANMASGAGRANLGGVLDTYHLLPLEQRKAHQLVVSGELDDPWAALAYLHDHGCSEGLVLVGPVEDATLRSLYARCAAFVSPSLPEASTLSLVEAMSLGAPIVAGRAGSQPEMVDDAGLLADPADPLEIAERVASVLSDVDLRQALRRKALARSRQFSWEPVVEEFFSALREDESRSRASRIRTDRAHRDRRRIAVFAGCSIGRSTSLSLKDRIVRTCRGAYDVDLYFPAGDAAQIGRLPLDFGGFDARQFARNDDILNYHAVVYLLPDVFALKSKLRRLRGRPGLVFLQDETSLARIEPEPHATASESLDVEAEIACQRLRELFLTPSRLVVQSRRNLEAIRSTFPCFADQVFEMPPIGADGGIGLNRRPSNASDLLSVLIEACATDMPRRPGRPQRTSSGLMLGLPTAPLSSGAALDSGDSYLEAR